MVKKGQKGVKSGEKGADGDRFLGDVSQTSNFLVRYNPLFLVF